MGLLTAPKTGTVNRDLCPWSPSQVKGKHAYTVWHEQDQQIHLPLCTNNDNRQSLETGRKMLFYVCEEVESAIRTWGAGLLGDIDWLTVYNVQQPLLWDPAVQKSPDGAVHTALKVLYLHVGTCMVFEEICCSCFCEASPLNFNLCLTLSMSNHIFVMLFTQNSLAAGIFEQGFTCMTFAARSAESTENMGEMHKLHWENI